MCKIPDQPARPTCTVGDCGEPAVFRYTAGPICVQLCDRHFHEAKDTGDFWPLTSRREPPPTREDS